jgi:DNA-binding transcriptional ArsR family regulator
MRRFARNCGAGSLPFLTAEQFHRISRAVSDSTRYDILRKVLASGGLTCGGAAEDLSISAATAAHHIRELFNAGFLVEVTRQGRHRIVGPRQRMEGFNAGCGRRAKAVRAGEAYARV